MDARTIAKISIIIGVLVVSPASIIVKLCNAPAIIIAVYRLGISGVVMSLIALKNMKEILELSKKAKTLLFLAGFSLAIHFTVWFESLEYTTVMSSILITNSAPIIVLALSAIFLKEKITKRDAAGVILSLLGASIIMHGHTFELHFYGDFLALIGTITLAVYFIIGRAVRPYLSLFPYVAVVYSTAFTVLLAISYFLGLDLIGYRGIDYVYMAFLALGPSCIGHTSYNYAVKYLKAYIVSLSILIEPFAASILAFIIFNEIPKITTIIGGAFILTGVAVTLKE